MKREALKSDDTLKTKDPFQSDIPMKADEPALVVLHQPRPSKSADHAKLVLGGTSTAVSYTSSNTGRFISKQNGGDDTTSYIKPKSADKIKEPHPSLIKCKLKEMAKCV